MGMQLFGGCGCFFRNNYLYKAMNDTQRKKKIKFNWPAIGAIVLILLLLVWFVIVDSDGDPNNGLILFF